MTEIPNIYLLLFLVLSAASILSKYYFSKYYPLFKPLPMILIISLPFILGSDVFSTYGVLILLGLLFSLAGDVLLLRPEKYFKAGLVSFLTAHVFYSVSFLSISSAVRFEAFVIYALFAFFIYKYLNEHLDKLKIPVIVYIAVISIMGALGLNQFVNSTFQFSFQIFIGSVLFIISDSVLAINKFRKPFFAAEIIILLTYYTSQLFFASSI